MFLGFNRNLYRPKPSRSALDLSFPGTRFFFLGLGFFQIRSEIVISFFLLLFPYPDLPLEKNGSGTIVAYCGSTRVDLDGLLLNMMN